MFEKTKEFLDQEVDTRRNLFLLTFTTDSHINNGCFCDVDCFIDNVAFIANE